VGFGDHSDARVVLSKQLPVHDAVFKSSQKSGDLQSVTPLAVRATVSSLHVSIAVRQQSIYSWLYLLFDGTIFSRDYA
jgi:acyl-CoA hydrolase